MQFILLTTEFVSIVELAFNFLVLGDGSFSNLEEATSAEETTIGDKGMEC